MCSDVHRLSTSLMCASTASSSLMYLLLGSSRLCALTTKVIRGINVNWGILDTQFLTLAFCQHELVIQPQHIHRRTAHGLQLRAGFEFAIGLWRGMCRPLRCSRNANAQMMARGVTTPWTPLLERATGFGDSAVFDYGRGNSDWQAV